MSVTVSDLALILDFLSGMIGQFFTSLDGVYIGDYSYLDYSLAFMYVFLTYSFIISAFGKRSDNDDNA